MSSTFTVGDAVVVTKLLSLDDAEGLKIGHWGIVMRNEDAVIGSSAYSVQFFHPALTNPEPRFMLHSQLCSVEEALQKKIFLEECKTVLEVGDVCADKQIPERLVAVLEIREETPFTGGSIKVTSYPKVWGNPVYTVTPESLALVHRAIEAVPKPPVNKAFNTLLEQLWPDEK